MERDAGKKMYLLIKFVQTLDSNNHFMWHSFFVINITLNVSGGQVVYGKALDMMVELLRNTKDENVLIALLSWFKTISELEDEREVSRKLKKKQIVNLLRSQTNKICIFMYFKWKKNSKWKMSLLLFVFIIINFKNNYIKSLKKFAGNSYYYVFCT